MARWPTVLIADFATAQPDAMIVAWIRFLISSDSKAMHTRLLHVVSKSRY